MRATLSRQSHLSSVDHQSILTFLVCDIQEHYFTKVNAHMSVLFARLQISALRLLLVTLSDM